ncbi:hypothetical protein ACQKWADRAFT_322781 [Trichoderma austrokoningii]
MASLGLSSLLPRQNGAGAPLVSPSVPVVWLQRKRQGILSHDRPLLRCGAGSVMLSHSSKASAMSAEAALSICPNEPQDGLPSAPQRAFFSAEQVHMQVYYSWMLILRPGVAGHMELGKNANLL